MQPIVYFLFHIKSFTGSPRSVLLIPGFIYLEFTANCDKSIRSEDIRSSFLYFFRSLIPTWFFSNPLLLGNSVLAPLYSLAAVLYYTTSSATGSAGSRVYNIISWKSYNRNKRIHGHGRENVQGVRRRIRNCERSAARAPVGRGDVFIPRRRKLERERVRELRNEPRESFRDSSRGIDRR